MCETNTWLHLGKLNHSDICPGVCVGVLFLSECPSSKFLHRVPHCVGNWRCLLELLLGASQGAFPERRPQLYPLNQELKNLWPSRCCWIPTPISPSQHSQSSGDDMCHSPTVAGGLQVPTPAISPSIPPDCSNSTFKGNAV